MYKYVFAASLLIPPLAVGCTGQPAPTTVTEDDRQQMAQQEADVAAEERAHRAQNK